MPLILSNRINIPDAELQLQAIRAQGAGGQNVNKVSTAIHLRFDISSSSLPDSYKERLLQLQDQRINSDGVVVIKAQRFRSQEKNKADALARLATLITSAMRPRKARKPSRPSRSSQKKRVDNKTRRGDLKSLRGKVKV